MPWWWCCGLYSFRGEGGEYFFWWRKPNRSRILSFFFLVGLLGFFFFACWCFLLLFLLPLEGRGTAHLLLTELFHFFNQDLLCGVGFFFPACSHCPVGLLWFHQLSSLPMVHVGYFSLFHTLLLLVSCISHVQLSSSLYLLILCVFFLSYFGKCQSLILLLEFIRCYKVLPSSHWFH